MFRSASGSRRKVRGSSPTTDASHTSHVSEHHEESNSFATDFAVDFLEPCEQPDTLGRLDDIEILELIGRGGMGVILKGYQRELGRYVAVKLMAPHLAASGSAASTGRVGRIPPPTPAIEKQIEDRERMRDDIIQHRVEELLNPNLRWAPTDDAPATSRLPAASEAGPTL